MTKTWSKLPKLSVQDSAERRGEGVKSTRQTLRSETTPSEPADVARGDQQGAAKLSLSTWKQKYAWLQRTNGQCARPITDSVANCYNFCILVSSKYYQTMQSPPPLIGHAEDRWVAAGLYM